jgi:hypothetical protein
LIVFRGNDFLAHTTLDHLKQTKGDIWNKEHQNF